MRKFRFMIWAIILILSLVLAGCDNLIIQNLLEDLSGKDNIFKLDLFFNLVEGKNISAESSFASKVIKISDDQWIVTKEGVWVDEVTTEWVVTKEEEWVDDVVPEWIVTKAEGWVDEVAPEWVVTKEEEWVDDIAPEWVVTKEEEWVDEYQPPYVVLKEAEWSPNGEIIEVDAIMRSGVSYNNITTTSVDLLLANDEKIGTVTLFKTGSGNIRTVDVTVTLDPEIENISLTEVRIYGSTTAPTVDNPGTLDKTNTNGEVTQITLVNNGDFVYVLATVEAESGYWTEEEGYLPPVVPGYLIEEEGYWTDAIPGYRIDEEGYWTDAIPGYRIEEEGFWTDAIPGYRIEEEGYWTDLIPGYLIEEEGYWTETIPGYWTDEEGHWVDGAFNIINTTRKTSFGYNPETDQIVENKGMIFMSINFIDNKDSTLTVTFDFETGVAELIKELHCAVSNNEISSDDIYVKVENFTHVCNYKSGDTVYIEAIMQF